MSWELINRITVKKDGVYISSHSSNDTAPFHSWRSDSLSGIYDTQGQKGLDLEIVRMLCEYCQLRGSHKSVERYRRVMESQTVKEIRRKFVDQTDERFQALSKEERMSCFRGEPLGKGEEYISFERELRENMYADIAGMLEAVPEKVVFSKMPWYTERWYDEDLAAAMTEAGIPVTQENLNKARDACRTIFDDKTERNEILKSAIENLSCFGCFQ